MIYKTNIFLSIILISFIAACGSDSQKETGSAKLALLETTTNQDIDTADAMLLASSSLNNKPDQKSSLTKSIFKNSKKKIWVDADLAVGMKRYNREGYSDVDDAYALLQLFKAENIDIKGISTVFGNTRIDDAYRLSNEMVSDFAPYDIPVYKGAAEKINLEKVESNAAVEAMSAALRKDQMAILAIGPATNIGTLLLLYPELKSQIKEVVLVAGRRTATSYFEIGNPTAHHAPDLNFDLDNDAFRILFESGVKVVLCPFEISNKVWITAEDLDSMKNGDLATSWLAEKSKPWLRQWEQVGETGFNPFDVLASHYLIAPEDIISEELNANLEIHENDMLLGSPENNFKQYLICDSENGFPVTYCYGVVDGYHNKLMKSLINN
ncbi:nucleoside hydrolase [Christiangramia echinicola]|uniref:Pyrimidine-specific ribonucleoside hydrolase n=1 Tax=Christiangramia echinicola TaxID=279359 RepID=A0A1H1SFJ3_9FLAO|nr:nucleoside hydrolase [Christiangramia echinicola]SDS46506.1 pyrimidine-specific ribonucleoside hydrolase [Christiangramia echinicola]